MIGKGTSESKPVPLAEVKRILEKRQGTAGEFGFEQQTTLSYSQRFAHLSHTDAAELQKEAEGLGLPAATAVKIADILPKNKAQIMLIFSKDKTELPEKKLAELEALVAKFSKKAKKFEPAKTEEPKIAEAPAEKEKSKEKEANEKEEKTN